jgi:thiol peroxidase
MESGALHRWGLIDALLIHTFARDRILRAGGQAIPGVPLLPGSVDHSAILRSIGFVLLLAARISGYLGHLEDDLDEPQLSTIEDEPPMAETRKGEVTFRGNPVELVGPKLKAGEKAPDFACVGAGLAIVGLKDSSGKARLFNVVPSLDTPVCNTQTRKFSQELQALGEKVAAYTVSLDMPFAQARWCGEAKVDNIKNLSDLHDQSFGQHYGVLIQGLPIPLLARSIFVLDPSDTIKYVQIVPEIVQEPDYEPALKALREAAGA